jgi:hypothetical protein
MPYSGNEFHKHTICQTNLHVNMQSGVTIIFMRVNVRESGHIRRHASHLPGQFDGPRIHPGSSWSTIVSNNDIQRWFTKGAGLVKSINSRSGVRTPDLLIHPLPKMAIVR